MLLYCVSGYASIVTLTLLGVFQYGVLAYLLPYLQSSVLVFSGQRVSSLLRTVFTYTYRVHLHLLTLYRVLCTEQEVSRSAAIRSTRTLECAFIAFRRVSYLEPYSTLSMYRICLLWKSCPVFVIGLFGWPA